MDNNINNNAAKSNGLFLVSAAPHIRIKDTTASIMRDVLIALVPTSIAGVYFFGLRALAIILVAIISAVVAEAASQKVMGRELTITDGSAAVTGLLLALNVPVALDLWKVALGSIFAIVIVKQLFGGLGANFMNPALAARAFLMSSFGAGMSNFTRPNTDLVSVATPLAGGPMTDNFQMLIGNMPGCIGEVSKLAILIGGLYLIFRKVISIKIPAVYIGSFLGFMALFGQTQTLHLHLLTGGLMLGAFFMATDYATSPMSALGQIVFAILLGLLTALIRVFGGYPEGVSYAILIMNMFVPLIDKYTIPKAFGQGGKNE